MGLIHMTGEVSRALQPRSRRRDRPRRIECPAKSLSPVLMRGFDPTQLIKKILETTHAD